MQVKKKGFLLIVLTLLTGLMLSGCASSASGSASYESSGNPSAAQPSSAEESAGEGEPLEFVFLSPNQGNPFWTAIGNGVTDAGTDQGANVTIYDAQDDPAKQISQAEDAISIGVDAIFMSPYESDTGTAATELANAAGIPIFILDVGAEGDYTGFVAADNAQGGRLAAEYILENTGDDRNVAEIQGVVARVVPAQRGVGFNEVMDAEDVPVNYVQPADCNRSKGMDIMDTFLTQDRTINAVFCWNDEMALGAKEAIAAHGLSEQVFLVGFDGTNEAVQAVLDGELAATIAQNPYQFGVQGVEMFFMHQNGEDFEKDYYIECELITAENARDYLESNG